MILDRILCVQEERKLSKSLSISYKGRVLYLTGVESPKRAIGKKVKIIHSRDEIKIFLDNKELHYQEYEEAALTVQEDVMDRKALDSFLNKKPPLTHIQKIRRGISVPS